MGTGDRGRAEESKSRGELCSQGQSCSRKQIWAYLANDLAACVEDDRKHLVGDAMRMRDLPTSRRGCPRRGLGEDIHDGRLLRGA